MTSEGRTDPQRRPTARRAVEDRLLHWSARDMDDYPPIDIADDLLNYLRSKGFEVVPADDQLTAEEAEALLYSVDVPVGSKDSRLLAKLRRIAGRKS